MGLALIKVLLVSTLGIYVMIYDRPKFECGKWRATFTATTYAEAVPVSAPCSYLVFCYRGRATFGTAVFQGRISGHR